MNELIGFIPAVLCLLALAAMIVLYFQLPDDEDWE